jgi:hypothetical protein
MPSPTHGVKHHIHTGSPPPIFAKSHRLDPETLEIAKAEFKRLETIGIVCCSESPWASPLHMVPKKDRSWRPCADYCRLNLITTPDKYLLPNMQDLLNSLHGCNIFSKINLVKGYPHIPVAATDIPKTVFIMPFGLFKYLVMPFGLSNVPQTFQHMMDRTVDGLEGVFAYMDDSHVGSLDRQTHLLHLEAFFKLFGHQWNGLTLNFQKCVFAVPDLELLGHTILAAELTPAAGHATAIESCPLPLRTSSSCSVFSAWQTFTAVSCQILRRCCTLYSIS